VGARRSPRFTEVPRAERQGISPWVFRTVCPNAGQHQAVEAAVVPQTRRTDHKEIRTMDDFTKRMIQNSA
jgi:hypothetical protein